MNYRPMVKVGSDPEFYGNAQVFATAEEAHESARDLMYRWLLVKEAGIEETDAPVNYRREDGHDVAA